MVFLNGFRSDMRGGKSTFVRQFCVEHGLAFATLDYSGHGLSGDFLNGTVSTWKGRRGSHRASQSSICGLRWGQCIGRMDRRFVSR